MTKSESTTIAHTDPKMPMKVGLTDGRELDLSGLPEEERKALLSEYYKGTLDIDRKARQMGMDTMIIKKNLDDFVETTRQANADNTSITLAHTQDSSVGRTEVIMGNSDRAQSGKLTKSQTGQTDWTPLYVIGGLIAAVAIIAAIAG